ncbi:glycosyltransferase family 2 protein [Riemerella anatipestifer]|uniref:glycosyltransferase family 2 protein n=1 Tax=Riemerella anatipestifer TaxID=34085 RepID=UPI001374FB88|nr:glycosyltransferase family 2 protein [Riemerella anatipestifer]MDY3363066.1 glycosyltransferase family 2 protein [Riemerella anatipestifer]
MRFLIIIPAHNEEDSILLCLKSLAKQTYQNFDCIVVNDGSTDKTKELVESFIKDNLSFKLKNLESSFHQPGAKVVQTFYRGLEEVSLADYDVICKFDADIIFPSQYLENINKIYTENPKAGMVSGLVYIQNDKGEWIYENLSSKNHVRGPIKSYRKDCFLAMNGLRSVLGWDNIDVMLAQMNGYDIITIKNLWVKHLRPTAYKYKSQKAEKLGEYFYNIGLNLPLAMISSAKSSFKNGSFSEFFITMKSFLSQNKSLQLTQEEIKFIRKLRNPLQKIFNRQ